MTTEIIIIYTICDELAKAMNIRDDSRSRMSTAEIMTVVLTAARFFGGHIENARVFLSENGYITDILSESRLNRRIHSISESVWQNLFLILSDAFVAANDCQEYIVDSFPVPVCDNIRISRSKIFTGEEYRGYIPSKRRYFYGIRVHMIVTASGEPVEFVIAPGRPADITIFKQMDIALPPGSQLFGDRGYNDYVYEDLLREADEIILRPIRKKNSVRATDSYIERLAHRKFRKRVETAFSQITSLFPKRIHAVTSKGFLSEVISFIITFNIRCLQMA